MPNRLIHESSPYLQQHAHNPVDWYPWGQEALDKAKAENKLLLVSVGYAACHWCHVMEHESFEDEAVAALMNEHFVCIKVDREERPDVDKIYMDAVMLMTQRGGWPLNAIALPDQRPIYGGTYFRRDQWMSVLNQLATMYQQEPQRAHEYAENLLQAMQEMDQVVKPAGEQAFEPTAISEMTAAWLEKVDFEWGGRKTSANKFPLPQNQRFLLRAGFFLPNDQALEAAHLTLHKMALGGIYDQLGGGFARYSVDPYWKVPHFEKMLYDNGQLLSVYSEAYQQNPQPIYQKVVFETVAWLEREMRDPSGGFYSSLDADSEGEEGKFYCWSKTEIEEVLGEAAKPFCDYYNVTEGGNWEGKNILFTLETEEEYAMRWDKDPDELAQQLAQGRWQLLEARKGRIRPGLDDKVLTSWNGLVLKGLADAYRVFGRSQLLELALANARFICEQMSEGDHLFRNFKAGKRSIPAFLDDYANVIDGLISLYEATFDEQWLRQADRYLQTVEAHFHDPRTGLYFYTSDEDEGLIRRKMELQDDVIPSSNAVIGHAFHALGLLLHRQSYLDRVRDMLSTMKATLLEHPSWHSCWALLLLKQQMPFYEVAITGPEAAELRRELETYYHPGRLFAGATQPSELPILVDRWGEVSRIFVCQNHTCQLPVTSVEEAMLQMR